MSYVCQVLAVREEEWRRDQGRWFRWGLVTCEPVTGSFTMNVGLSTLGVKPQVNGIAPSYLSWNLAGI